MVLFAILCVVLIWPLGRGLRRRGFNLNTYVLCALLAYLIGGVGTVVAVLLGAPVILAILGPLAAVLINHLLFELVASERSAAVVAAKVAALDQEDRAAIARTEAVAEAISRLVCLKSYGTPAQQYEYLGDRDRLDAAGIRFVVRSAGITSLYVASADAERAAELLGVAVTDADPGEGAGAPPG